MKNWFFLLALLSMQLTYAQKKTAAPADPLAGIDTILQKILKDRKAVGFAVAVVKKDKIIYAKGFGYRDDEQKLPVTPNTLFAIGSCTKAFTSSLMGMFNKENKLEYDKPARDYLPALQFYNNELNNGVTVRDLMCHRTGLPGMIFPGTFLILIPVTVCYSGSNTRNLPPLCARPGSIIISCSWFKV